MLIALALATVPVAYFGPLSVTGVPIVEGCSGAGPGPAGIFQVAAPKVMTGPVPFGTDGFFALTVLSRELTAQETLAALSVTVETSNGDPIPGALSILQTRSIGEPSDEPHDQTIVGWSSTSPLDPGVDLTAQVTGSGGDPVRP